MLSLLTVPGSLATNRAGSSDRLHAGRRARDETPNETAKYNVSMVPNKNNITVVETGTIKKLFVIPSFIRLKNMCAAEQCVAVPVLEFVCDDNNGRPHRGV